MLHYRSKAMFDPSDLIVTKWDSAEYLETEEEMQVYLQACIEEAEHDAAFITKTLETIAQAKSISL